MRFSNRILNSVRGSLDKKIFFLHIPKCAGSSLTNAVVKNYISLNLREDSKIIRMQAEVVANARQILSDENSSEYSVADDCSVRIPEYLLLYFMGLEKVKFITGHVPFSDMAYSKFHHQYSFITILRDPVSRWLSEYTFNKFKKSMHRKQTADMGIEEYINSKVGKEQGRQYVLFLGGRVNSKDYISKTAIERAINNLNKFSVIGCVENMQDFTDRYYQRFGMKLNIENKNVNPRPKEWEEKNFTDDIRRKVENICEADCEIYYRMQQYLKNEF
jgi:hypothetical protein